MSVQFSHLCGYQALTLDSLSLLLSGPWCPLFLHLILFCFGSHIPQSPYFLQVFTVSWMHTFLNSQSSTEVLESEVRQKANL